MSSGFITESELAEARQKRQEEWEKVRTADQPLEAPEEQYDPRSLFERLQEQKQKKDLEYEEAHKLKNLVKGLDDDEVEFLDLVDKNKLNAERQTQLEEAKEMNEFRQKVASLQEKRLDEQIQQQIAKPKTTKAPIVSSRVSQKKILAGGLVVKKRKLDGEEASNGKAEEDRAETAAPTTTTTSCKPDVEETKADGEDNQPSPSKKPRGGGGGAMQVIGILPGLGNYRESTDSEDSSDSSGDCGQYDWVGRKLGKNKSECGK